jgi:hypothetical protein
MAQTPMTETVGGAIEATIIGIENLGGPFLAIRTMKDATRTAHRPTAVLTPSEAYHSTMDIKTGTTKDVMTLVTTIATTRFGRDVTDQGIMGMTGGTARKMITGTSIEMVSETGTTTAIVRQTTRVIGTDRR